MSRKSLTHNPVDLCHAVASPVYRSGVDSTRARQWRPVGASGCYRCAGHLQRPSQMNAVPVLDALAPDHQALPRRLGRSAHLDGMQRTVGGVSGAGRDERFGGNDHDAGIGLVTDGDRQLCVRRTPCRICA